MRRPPKQNLFNINISRHLHRQKVSFFHTEPQKIINQFQYSKDLNFVQSTHSKLFKSGFLNQTFYTNHLINAYIRCKNVNNAHQLFDEMLDPNTISWTSLMGGYTAAKQPNMAVWLFAKMPKNIVFPNAFTLSTVVNACSVLADVKAGKLVHAFVEVYGYQTNLIVCASLVDMYGKSNDLGSARRVFDSMVERNVVPWTSMIVGYAQNAQVYEALKLFREFSRVADDPPNQYMLSIVVNACASLGRLVYGKVTHAAVVKRGHESNEVVATALADMYAKCGCFESSLKVFRRMLNSCLISYTSMIMSAAKHGLGEVSLELFEEMILKGIKPTDVTYLGILYACSHSGLVDRGLELLNSMQAEHGVIPDVKHYTCVVDMLGRRGRLDEAYRLAKTIELRHDSEGALLWGSLLSASKLHGRLDIADEASKWLIEAKQQVDTAYVSMSNIHVLTGNWDDSQSIRSEMKRVGVRKEPGCSWVEIKDSVYVFYARDVSSCPRGMEVLELLKDLENRMKERGYIGGSKGLVFVDVEDESKEEIVNLHSERLALGFSLLSIPKGETIRIMKNLRMCGDCHEAFKLISSIVERDFVVRDVNRFHHFKNGSCSCKDYW
ncbi:pentatricopeptide repeat-containing protein At4g15720-like [Chenopodium quinoa]|nr:pentatricopeptide repeat-containing protein At4g15720-like [Chenopodium quinoa]